MYHRKAKFYVKVDLLHQSTSARYLLFTRHTFSGEFPVGSLGRICAHFDETFIFALKFVLPAIIIGLTFILLSLSFCEPVVVILRAANLAQFTSAKSWFKL